MARRRMTRRAILRAGAAAAAAGVVVASGRAFSPTVLAQSDADVELANLALTWEYLERDFVAAGLEASLLDGRDRELVTEIARHLEATVELITQAIRQVGARPIERPGFTFPPETLAQRDAFLLQASLFAEWAVNAYQGQLAAVRRRELLETGAAIAGAKSRHAAVLGLLSGGDPLPAPVEQGRTASELLQLARPFRGEG